MYTLLLPIDFKCVCRQIYSTLQSFNILSPVRNVIMHRARLIMGENDRNKENVATRMAFYITHKHASMVRIAVTRVAVKILSITVSMVILP